MLINKYSELEADDAGLAALVVIARFHGIATDAAQLKHAAAITTGRFSEHDLVRSARTIGLKARVVPFRSASLTTTPLPALILDREGRHFIIARPTARRRWC